MTKTVSGVAAHLVVHLGDQWAGSVDDVEVTTFGLVADGWRDAVRREHQSRAVGHLVELVHEHRAALLQIPYHVGIVHDLAADVDGFLVPFQRPLHDVDGSLDTSTE